MTKQKRQRKIIGTNMFEVSFFNAKNVRGGKSSPDHFVYRQWGRVRQIGTNGQIIKDEPFNEFGKLITIMNEIVRKEIKKNLKEQKKKSKSGDDDGKLRS